MTTEKMLDKLMALIKVQQEQAGEDRQLIQKQNATIMQQQAALQQLMSQVLVPCLGGMSGEAYDNAVTSL